MTSFVQKENLFVEVAYATPQKQMILKVPLQTGMTAEMAIQSSGISKHFPEIDLKTCKIGVFSHPVDLETLLNNGDRVEIYRPLIADPKEVRRQRAESKAI